MQACEQDPEILAGLAHQRMQGKREQLVEALEAHALSTPPLLISQSAPPAGLLRSPAPRVGSRDCSSHLGAYYQRLRKRMGHKKALVALAHRILIIIYHLLKEQQAYRELGPWHVDEKAAEVAKCRALRTLEQLGYDLALQLAEIA